MTASRFWRSWLPVFFLVAANASAQAPPQSPAPKPIAERVKELEDRIDVLQGSVDTLMALTGDRSATLDCSGGASVPVLPSLHTFEFLAICSAVDPYLEGYRIKLRIGNPQSLSFYGFEGELGYGETFGKTFGQHIHFTTTEDLTAGGWTNIQVTINPVAAKDVRVLRIYGLTTKGTKVR